MVSGMRFCLTSGSVKSGSTPRSADGCSSGSLMISDETVALLTLKNERIFLVNLVR